MFVSAVSIAEMVIKRMSTLPLLHRDPFDRLLIAQSLEVGLTLITSDQAIWQYAGVSLLKNE